MVSAVVACLTEATEALASENAVDDGSTELATIPVSVTLPVAPALTLSLAPELGRERGLSTRSEGRRGCGPGLLGAEGGGVGGGRKGGGEVEDNDEGEKDEDEDEDNADDADVWVWFCDGLLRRVTGSQEPDDRNADDNDCGGRDAESDDAGEDEADEVEDEEVEEVGVLCVEDDPGRRANGCGCGFIAESVTGEYASEAAKDDGERISSLPGDDDVEVDADVEVICCCCCCARLGGGITKRGPRGVKGREGRAKDTGPWLWLWLWP